MLFQPVVVVGNQLFHHRVQRANILRSGMDISVDQIDKHFNAVNRLGDRTRVISVYPIDLVKHCFDFLVGHLGDVANRDTLLFQLFPSFHEVFRVGIVGHDRGDPLHDLVDRAFKSTAVDSTFNDVFQPFRYFQRVLPGDGVSHGCSKGSKSLIVAIEVLVHEFFNSLCIRLFRRYFHNFHSGSSISRIVICKRNQRNADCGKSNTACEQHRQKLL